MSSLIPGAETVANGSPSLVSRSAPGAAAVRVRVHEQLGAATERRVGDGVEVADDHVRLHPHLEQRVGASVDGEEHRLEVADVRPHDPEVALVARPARDDDRVPLAEARLQRRELDPVGEQLPLVAQVAERVVGERLERLGDPALLVGERAASVASVSSIPSASRVPLRHSSPLRTVSVSPSATCSKRSAPGASTRQTPARTSSSGPGFGKRPELEGETLTTARTPESASSSAETRSRSTWSMIARSPGRSRLTRSFVRRPEPRGADDLGHGGDSDEAMAVRNSSPPSIRSSSARRSSARELLDPRVRRVARHLLDPEVPLGDARDLRQVRDRDDLRALRQPRRASRRRDGR